MIDFIWQSRSFAPFTDIGGISYQVERYSKSNIGGPKLAIISAFGDPFALYKLTARLRNGVIITNELGTDVWWGYLDAVEIRTQNMSLRVSLADMWNNIRVQYTSETTSTTTAAATKAQSVSLYGTKEIIIPASDIDTATAAEAMRDRLVGFYGVPHVERSPEGGGETSATLTFAGWWNTLNWRYYTNAGTDSVDTTALISDIVTNYGQFLAGSFIKTTSGITILETREGNQRAGDEIAKLVEIGKSGGNRLYATITKSRHLLVNEEVDQGERDYVFQTGRIENNQGALVPPSLCPVGVWVSVTDEILGQYNIQSIADTGRFYVEEATYEVASNRWNPTPRGSYQGGLGLI